VAGNAIIVGRHTSIGDAAIPAALFGNAAGLNTRYVLTRGLMWGPCLDLVGHRLINHFVARRGSDTATEAAAVGALTDGFGDHAVAVIFPEGQFFSPERKARALERLRAGSRPELAERADALHYLLPPRPAGVLALLEGAPDADVVVLGHVGLEAFTSMAAIVRQVPMRRAVRVWMWRVERAEIPFDDDARVDWLYDQWSRLDRTVADHQETP
jgi:1-acyl-sn-glycerol-3-phosphate acyltransferase